MGYGCNSFGESPVLVLGAAKLTARPPQSNTSRVCRLDRTILESLRRKACVIATIYVGLILASVVIEEQVLKSYMTASFYTVHVKSIVAKYGNPLRSGWLPMLPKLPMFLSVSPSWQAEIWRSASTFPVPEPGGNILVRVP